MKNNNFLKYDNNYTHHMYARFFGFDSLGYPTYRTEGITLQINGNSYALELFRFYEGTPESFKIWNPI